MKRPHKNKIKKEMKRERPLPRGYIPGTLDAEAVATTAAKEVVKDGVYIHASNFMPR